jgi:hypothetical protein
MVPIEVRAFGMLAVCVILLAALLIVQWVPARARGRREAGDAPGPHRGGGARDHRARHDGAVTDAGVAGAAEPHSCPNDYVPTSVYFTSQR